MYGIFSLLCGVVLSCWLMYRVHFSFIKARASSAGHTAFEVEHAALKAHLQIRPFEAGIRLQIQAFTNCALLAPIRVTVIRSNSYFRFNISERAQKIRSNFVSLSRLRIIRISLIAIASTFG